MKKKNKLDVSDEIKVCLGKLGNHHRSHRR